MAYFIDCGIAFGLVMLLIQWLVLLRLRGDLGITDEWMHDPWHLLAYVWLSISLPVYLYFSLFDRTTKGTPGRRIFSLSITRANGSGSVGFGRAFLRTWLKLLPWELAHLGVIFPEPLYFSEDGDIGIFTYIGLTLLLIYFIGVLASSKHQTLYDQLLGTVVTLKRSEI